MHAYGLCLKICLIQLRIPNISFYLFVYFLNNIIVTNKSAHTAIKERMVPDIRTIKVILCHQNMTPNIQLHNGMEREVAITPSFLLCSIHYTALQMKNSTDAINPVATENMGDKHNSQPQGNHITN